MPGNVTGVFTAAVHRVLTARARDNLTDTYIVLAGFPGRILPFCRESPLDITQMAQLVNYLDHMVTRYAVNPSLP